MEKFGENWRSTITSLIYKIHHNYQAMKNEYFFEILNRQFAMHSFRHSTFQVFLKTPGGFRKVKSEKVKSHHSDENLKNKYCVYFLFRSLYRLKHFSTSTFLWAAVAMSSIQKNRDWLFFKHNTPSSTRR